MVKGKKIPPGQRGGDIRDLNPVRGIDNRKRLREDPEDDPLRDLRPDDEEMRYPVSDDYIWPDLSENEEDD